MDPSACSRREFAGLSVAGLLWTCFRPKANRSDDDGRTELAGDDDAPADSGGDWRSLRFDPSDVQPEGQAAQVYVPAQSDGAPILVALHGHGESGRGLDVGANAWRHDYGLDKIYERLLAPPMTTADVGGFLDDDRILRINRSLEKDPFRGLAVACPYTPDVGAPDSDAARDYATFVTRDLLPRAADAMGTELDRTRTGIDGVSMGGRMALIVGLAHPEIFGAVGGLMPAIAPFEAHMLADLAARAHAKAPIRIRLVTSDLDPYAEAVRAFAAELDRTSVPHALVMTHGPHDYVWNKGPGSCELLMFHERVLRGLTAP